MPVKTPWQFGDRSTNKDTSEMFPQLNIEHPFKRIADPKDLNLRGTSQLSYRSNSRASYKCTPRLQDGTHLPVIPDGVEVTVAKDRSKPHIPIFGRSSEISGSIESRLTRYSSASSSSQQNGLSTHELEVLLRQKINSGYFALKNLFLSYDPDYGKIERSTLQSVLSRFLLTKLSLSQFHRLMKRLGLDNKKIITFDKFYNLFKKPTDKVSNSKENVYPNWFEPAVYEDTFSSAATVHSYLTNEAKDKTSFLEKLDISANSKLYKAVFLEKLKDLDLKLKPSEFEKLWKKYDHKNSVSIEVTELLHILNGNGRYSGSRSQLLSTNDNNNNSTREESINIEKWLTKKFREGATDMLCAFKEFDNNSGTVSRDTFILVLKDYGLMLKEEAIDDFLQRCNMTSDNGLIDYKDFLRMFQSRSDHGVTTKVLQNTNHRFHRQVDERSVQTGISSIEAKLIDMFQRDYFTLLNKLQKIDKTNSGLLTNIEFRAALESFFKSSFTESQYELLIKDVQKVNGRVNYVDFMAKFDTNHACDSLFDTVSSDEPDNEDDDDPFRSMSQCTKTTYRDERPVQEVADLIKQVVKLKYHLIEKVFRELDGKNTNRMTVSTMRRLLKKCDVYISSSEAKSVWKNLITDQNGTLNFNQFVRHFGYSIKSAAFPNSKHHPPTRGDCDYRIKSKKFNSWIDLIKDYARSTLEKNYASLLFTFENIDSNKTGYIATQQFEVALEQICPDLTKSEIHLITNKMDSAGRIAWMSFMNHLKSNRLLSRTGYNMSQILKHSEPVKK